MKLVLQLKPDYKQFADIIASDDLIETITKGQLHFDIVKIATPDMTPKRKLRAIDITRYRRIIVSRI